MTKNLPENTNGSDTDASSDSKNVLNIGQFHYHGNDIKELRKLAEANPELALEVVQGRDKENERSNVSYRFGIAASVILLLGILGAFSSIVIFGGLVQALVVVMAVFVSAIFVRVVLTGQWSDTSMMGKLINLVVRVFGGNTDSD